MTYRTKNPEISRNSMVFLTLEPSWVKWAQRIQKKYESILRTQRPYYQEQEKLLRIEKPKGHLKRSKDHKLFTALWKHRKAILLFMYQQEVPFDNNQAERDLRMLKVKMKISNHFQTVQWLNVHATIRSFISTAQKRTSISWNASLILTSIR
jgi:transposase